MRIHLVNPSDASFGIGVITPRWLYVLAAATPSEYGDPVIGPNGYWIASPSSFVSVDESRARLIPLAIGFRWQRPMGRSALAPYVEILPTVFLMRWKMAAHGTAYVGADSSFTFSDDERFTRIVPGLTLGAGFHIRGGDSWSFDYGAQLRGSTGFHRDEPPPGLEDHLRGIGNLALMIGLDWAPASPP